MITTKQLRVLLVVLCVFLPLYCGVSAWCGGGSFAVGVVGGVAGVFLALAVGVVAVKL